jgi:hypothetical protein
MVDQAVSRGDFFGTTIEDQGYIWLLNDNEAVRYGIPDPDYRSKVVVSDVTKLREALSTVPMFLNKSFVIHKLTLKPGQYYPRIARPNDQHPTQTPGNLPGDWKIDQTVFGALGQIRSLVGLLDQIVQSVHPVDANFNCFGTSIRNLIILAATECEAQWKGVLRSNGVTRAQLTTNDYVKLKDAMRLDEFEVRLRHFPWLSGFAPFKNWNSQSPTKSLEWYNTYNSVKHDRETHFEHATLLRAFEAVAALWIMIAAQFGIGALREFSDLGSYFELAKVPTWRYSDVYTLDYQDTFADPVAVHYPF